MHDAQNRRSVAFLVHGEEGDGQRPFGHVAHIVDRTVDVAQAPVAAAWTPVAGLLFPEAVHGVQGGDLGSAVADQTRINAWRELGALADG